jgi:hypothetical protein
MKLYMLLLSFLILPVQADAEIYKWKDKNGAVLYSDVPPPSNIKQETMIGKKNPKPTGLAPLAEVEGDATAAVNRDKAASTKDKSAVGKPVLDKTKAPATQVKTDKVPLSKEEVTTKRAADIDQQQKVEVAKQADLKIKTENCRAARANLATYTNGGRIAKTNENGEKEYLGDADIAQAKADSQRDVEKYCD